MGNTTFHSIDDRRSVNTLGRAQPMLNKNNIPIVSERQMTSIVIEE